MARSMNPLEHVRRFLEEGVWEQDPNRGSLARRSIRFLQLVVMIAEGFVRDRLLLRASALTYFTVLALVPMIAVAISLVGSFGAGTERLAEIMVGQIAAGNPEAHRRILELIRQVDLGRMGTLGATVLVVTTVLGISNVERAFNDIWGVRNPRGWARRFPDYLAVFVAGPLLLGVALSISTSLQSQWLVHRLLELEVLGGFFAAALRHTAVVALCAALSFLYGFLPNTTVRIRAALLGGIVAGVFIVIAQNVYIGFSMGVARNNAIYGSFAALPLLLVWIYVFWAIVLLGAELAFAYQNLALYRQEVQASGVSPAERTKIAIRIALEAALAFRRGAGPQSASELAARLSVPVRTVRGTLEDLRDAGLLSAAADDGRDLGFQLARPADSILVAEILAAVRGTREAMDEESVEGRVAEQLLRDLEAGETAGGGERTLADVAKNAQYHGKKKG